MANTGAKTNKFLSQLGASRDNNDVFEVDLKTIKFGKSRKTAWKRQERRPGNGDPLRLKSKNNILALKCPDAGASFLVRPS